MDGFQIYFLDPNNITKKGLLAQIRYINPYIIYAELLKGTLLVYL